MTDCEFVADVLADGKWHSTSEVLAYSLHERGHGLTVHSRVSDLRARGYKIEHRVGRGSRAQAHQYRLAVRPGEGETPDGDPRLPGPSPTTVPAGPVDPPSVREEPQRPAQQLSVFEAA